MNIVSKEMANISGKVAVAASGGMDSMCLLDVLTKISKDRFELMVVNVEHGIRDEASKRDSQMVTFLCQIRNIECVSVSVDSPTYALQHKISLESAARILRYRVFDNLLSEGKADYIALAHHVDDVCETVMMRIFRGTGINGLVGIQKRDRYLRPLLKVTREDIENYVCENAVGFVVDETNFNTDFSRNYVRHKILPLVDKKWSGYRKSIIRLTEISKETVDYFNRVAPQPIREGEFVTLNIDVLKQSDPLLVKYAIRHAVDILNNGIDFEEVHLAKVVALINQRNGASIDLSGFLRVWKEYDKLVFGYYQECKQEPLPFKAGEFVFANKTWEIAPRDNELLRFDITKIPQNAVIRARIDGDVFTRFGNKTTSLGDYYTNKKVPKRLRETMPIIAVGNNVLVTPIEIAESVKSNGDNEYTLRIKQ